MAFILPASPLTSPTKSEKSAVARLLRRESPMDRFGRCVKTPPHSPSNSRRNSISNLTPMSTPTTSRRNSGVGVTGVDVLNSPARRDSFSGVLSSADDDWSPSNSGSLPRKAQRQDGDRYIPSRLRFDAEIANYNLVSDSATSRSCLDTSPAKETYKRTMESAMFQGRSKGRLLSLENTPVTNAEGEATNVLNSCTLRSEAPQRKCHRTLPDVPVRTLDAPELLEDYYLNLLDWSSNDIVAVALHQSVYLWNATNGDIQKVLELEPDSYVSSLSWMDGGQFLAVGTSEAEVQLWDVTKNKQVRTFGGHQLRVGALAWHNYLLSSGSRDSSIHNHDVRIRQHHVSSFLRHTQDVCGLKWSSDGYLASGGNDNLLNVWSLHRTTPKFTFDHHKAAVKGLAWCPWEHNLLASGGGTADRTIRFWNTDTGACLNSIDTKSQVCAIQWSRHHKELVSSHGFSQNQLIVWKYPTMVKVCELTGHTSRVLHLTTSPDGQTVCSAGDETLRFWNIFEKPSSSGEEERVEKKRSLHSMSIR